MSIDVVTFSVNHLIIFVTQVFAVIMLSVSIIISIDESLQLQHYYLCKRWHALKLSLRVKHTIG